MAKPPRKNTTQKHKAIGGTREPPLEACAPTWNPNRLREILKMVGFENQTLRVSLLRVTSTPSSLSALKKPLTLSKLSQDERLFQH